MTDPNHALILDLVEWVSTGQRTYAEVMDAWRTSCPRLTIWEDALDRGYLRRATVDGVAMVSVTAAGRHALRLAAGHLVQTPNMGRQGCSSGSFADKH